MVIRRRGWAAAVIASGLAAALTACATGESAAGIVLPASEKKTAAPAAEEAKASLPSAEELLEQAIAASGKVTGYALQTDREEHVAAAPDREPDAHYVIETRLTTNPLAAYRELDIQEEGGPDQEPLKRYMNEEAVYSSYRGGDWMREPREDLSATLEHLRRSTDLSAQLQNLREAGGERTVTEQAGHPVLKVVLEGEEYRNIAEQYMRQSDDSLPNMQSNNSEWTMVRLEIVYEFDRNSRLPAASTVEFEWKRPESAKLYPGITKKFGMRATYSDYDNVEPIEIPEEAAGQAANPDS
ncbi:DUF6612 family protein [Saccharibacillus alkalitolerans]|uniref:Lipoprotein n=1 Tax=Saccharibacillus alkalitolerans TaxID=2705290 RepID=A0ABX0F0B7_9BACL|nr:DUF6612 family protein [Saccharibacillus alkalitolerans]NGZ74438.1 hypothetical protein [Saccharibacillus alkalitolerans]